MADGGGGAEHAADSADWPVRGGAEHAADSADSHLRGAPQPATPAADMSIGLVCIDVDGTLVGADGGVHPAVWPAVTRTLARGIRLALCSGRPGFGVTRELAARLDPTGWHCFQNGASVVELASGRTHAAAIDPASVTELVARARTQYRLLELYSHRDYAWEGPPDRAREHAALLGLPFLARPFSGLRGDVVRAQWVIGHDQTELVLAEPHASLELSLSYSPAMPGTRFINITAAGVDKGSAVRFIAAEYGLPLERVMFVGDSGNDAAAMRIVGWPVAMANAEPDALALARATVGHVDEGGVAAALRLAEHAGN